MLENNFLKDGFFLLITELKDINLEELLDVPIESLPDGLKSKEQMAVEKEIHSMLENKLEVAVLHNELSRLAEENDDLKKTIAKNSKKCQQ